ncbi:MAG: hypothetical protein V1702_06335 [Candidatus Woesearchaeota archaeon]
MARNLGKILITILIVVVMVSSIIGFVFSDISMGGQNTNSLSYNGYTFTQSNTGVEMKLNGQTLAFSYLPSQVDFIPLNGTVLEPLTATRMAYITSDANSTNAIAMGGFTYTVSEALKAKGSFGVQAFIASNAFSKPVVTCLNATKFVPVILVQDSFNTTEIYLENNCIIVNATSSIDIERLGDRLSYGILGVIE